MIKPKKTKKEEIPVEQLISKKTFDLVRARVDELTKDLSDYLTKQAGDRDGKDKDSEVQGIVSEETIRTNRLCSIKKQLKGKTVITPIYQKEVVALGSKIVWINGGKEELIVVDGVGYQDKEKKIKIINISTAVGKKLIGRKPGDVIEGLNGMELTIKEVRYP